MNRKLRPSAFSRTLALVPPAVALVAQHAEANLFLKIETSTGATIAGESTDQLHPGWIDAQNFGFSISNPPNLSGGVLTGTKSVAKELIISKSLDKSSPQLFLGCAMGTIFPTVTLELQQATAVGTAVYYRITLTDVLVSSLSTNSAVDTRPSESVAFSYAKMKLEYYMMNAKGGTTLIPAVSWDFANAKS